MSYLFQPDFPVYLKSAYVTGVYNCAITVFDNRCRLAAAYMQPMQLFDTALVSREFVIAFGDFLGGDLLVLCLFVYPEGIINI